MNLRLPLLATTLALLVSACSDGDNTDKGLCPPKPPTIDPSAPTLVAAPLVQQTMVNQPLTVDLSGSVTVANIDSWSPDARKRYRYHRHGYGFQ